MARTLSEQNITRFDPTNIEDITPVFVDRKFGRPEDYIEIFITDLNDQILDNIPDFTDYKVPQDNPYGALTNDFDLDPKSILNNRGYQTGTFKLYVNIQKRKIFNDFNHPFRVKEISSDRTEIKLSTIYTNEDLRNNSRKFINDIQNSPYFRDFTLKFDDNVNLLGLNADLDTSNSNEFLLLIKLFKPLPGNINEGIHLSIVEDITDPLILTYDLGLPEPADTSIPLRGPNFKIDTRLNGSVPTAFKSYDDILTTETTSSYQKLLSRLDGYEIPEIDYSYIRPVPTASLDFLSVTPSHFENFVHFGSATERLKNFEYKLKLIEIYNKQLIEIRTITGDTSGSSIILNATSSIETKKENLIQGFDGYEQFLYFESGTYSWPKTNSVEPYLLESTTSDVAKTWMGSNDSFNSYYGGQLLSASVFDSQNPNRLFKLTPTFIGDNLDNQPFETFCNMVGTHFDPIWAHIKEITQIRDNSHKLGVSKDLVYYALQSLGIEAYDQFENSNLIDYVFGSTFTTTDTATVITASNEIFSKQDISKEVWKRLYHNAPYLLKTKGTERGLRALINCYGIPDTILDIKEYGSSHPDRDEFKLYTYNKFTKVIDGHSRDAEGFFIETQWSSSFTQELSASAQTVEFRVKPNKLGELNKGFIPKNNQHLFSLSSSISASDLHLLLEEYGEGEEVITNPNFLNPVTVAGGEGFPGYTLQDVENEGTFTKVNPNTIRIEATADSDTTGNDFGYYLRLQQKNLPLQLGKKYKFSFEVRTNRANAIIISISTSNGQQIQSQLIRPGSPYNETTFTKFEDFFVCTYVDNDNNTVDTNPGTNDGHIMFHAYMHGLGTPKFSTGDFFEIKNLTVVEVTTDNKPIDFYEVGDNVKFGRLNLHQFTSSIATTDYFPIFDGDFWNIFIGTDGASGSDATTKFGAYQANHLRQVDFYTASIALPERINSEVWGNRFYNGVTEGELMIDGTLDDAANFTAQTGFAVSSGVATYSGGGTNSKLRSSNLNVVDGRTYQVVFDLTDTDGGGVFVRLSGGSFTSVITGTATHTVQVVAGSSGTKLDFETGDDSKTFTLDNISVKEINPKRHTGADKCYFGGIRNIFNSAAALAENAFTSSNYFIETPTAEYTGSAFDLDFSGSLSEVRIYKGELLSHDTLRKHALEPLMYAGNTITSSYDGLIVRYPLSFELDLQHLTSSQLPSGSIPGPGGVGGAGATGTAWNQSPTSTGLQSPTIPLTGPITGGYILSSSLDPNQTTSPATTYSGQFFPTGSVPGAGFPIFTVAGTPLLQSHHPNEKIEYLEGFTFFGNDDIVLLEEEHHLPTPNTIGKSPINKKIRIDSGSTDDDILSPDILSQLPSANRQVPDFDAISVFLSPQNEMNEDIIYTLGTFSLDEFLGDPRDQISGSYPQIETLKNHYFKKLEKGSQKQNIFDFTRWIQFIDHTLFDLIKQFVPQRSTTKTGLLIEPHYLERSKFHRFHPSQSNHVLDSTIQEITASFHKNSNFSQLDNTTGSAVITQYNFIGTGSDGRELQSGYNFAIDPVKYFTGSSAWEQGPIIPNSTGSSISSSDAAYGNIFGVKQRNSSGSNEFRPALTPYGNYMNSRKSRKVSKSDIEYKNLTIAHSEGKNLIGHFIPSDSAVTVNSSSIEYASAGSGQKANIKFSQNVTEGGSGTGYTPKIGRRYRLKYTISDYSAGAIAPRIMTKNGHYFQFTQRGANGTFIETGTIDGSLQQAYYNRFWFQAVGTTTLTISDITLEEVNPLRDVEFDDSLIEMGGWNLPRHKGSKLTGAKINEYTAGDITYGLNPVINQKSAAIYFGKSLIGADGEDDSLVTIKNHSYLDIEKIILINKHSDKITELDLKNEKYKGVNGYIANDFKDGASFNIELLDDKITHKLKDTYKAKFSQGYLYKVLEHKGHNGSGNIAGEGIQVGYLDVASSSPYATSTNQNVLCYGKDDSTINSSTIVLKENTLTKKIWPQNQTFGRVDFLTSSINNHYYSSWDNLGAFINSMLIPVASESQHRLFGTVNLGQPINVADYTTGSNAGIKNISTFEFDLEAYVTNGSLHDQISGSANMSGFGRALNRPDHLLIPIMRGPHDVITDKKAGANITWPGDGGNTGGSHSGATDVQLQFYFSGNANIGSAIYQISYLEETNTIIADVDKPIELANDVGDKGYILIPDNLDKDIKDNLDFFLNQAGYKEGKIPERIPNRKE